MSKSDQDLFGIEVNLDSRSVDLSLFFQEIDLSVDATADGLKQASDLFPGFDAGDELTSKIKQDVSSRVTRDLNVRLGALLHDLYLDINWDIFDAFIGAIPPPIDEARKESFYLREWDRSRKRRPVGRRPDTVESVEAEVFAAMERLRSAGKSLTRENAIKFGGMALSTSANLDRKLRNAEVRSWSQLKRLFNLKSDAKIRG